MANADARHVAGLMQQAMDWHQILILAPVGSSDHTVARLEFGILEHLIIRSRGVDREALREALGFVLGFGAPDAWLGND